jgi:hypothetical protein
VTLITDWPIIAQPPMPPNSAAAMLAPPCPRIPALVAVGVGHVVDDLRGQQRFQQADRGHRATNRAG